MPPHEFEHMQWAKQVESSARKDLAASGMPHCSWADLSLDPRTIPVAEPNYYGLPRWKTALADRFGVPVERVVPVAGASAAIFVAVALHVRPGERVVVESPGYGALRSAPALFGATVEPLPRPFENGFHIDLDALSKLVRRPPKLLLVSDLHNPSGVRLTDEEREALVRAAEDGGFTILCDEVYREFLPDAPDPLSRRSARVLSAGSLTKAFGLGPIRAGWILAPESDAAGLRRVLDATYVENASFAEAVATHALMNLERLRARTREMLGPRRAVFDEWLLSRPDLPCIRVPEVPFSFPRLPWGIDGRRFSDELLSRFSIAAVPGEFFGDSRHARLSCAALGPELLRDVLQEVSGVLDSFVEPLPGPKGGTV